MDLPNFYEPEVVGVIQKFVRPGDLAVDAGASIGFFTRILSELVGSEGRVLAFEPNLESFGYLQENIRKHGLTNVRELRMALWSCDRPEIRLWSSHQIGYTSICHYVNASGSEVVEARSLDSLLGDAVHPRFMKIDCELAELEILRGSERILERGVDCVVLEFNYNLLDQNGMSDHLIRDYMHELGYDMFLISIGDGSDGFLDPIRVAPERHIKLHGEQQHINVMFSTEEKVRRKWPTSVGT